MKSSTGGSGSRQGMFTETYKEFAGTRMTEFICSLVETIFNEKMYELFPIIAMEDLW